MITIRLTPNEVLVAAHLSFMRRWTNMAGIDHDQKPEPDRENEWSNDINAACAELAFCKYSREYWTGLSMPGAPDSQYGEIRWTRHYDKGGLILRDRDDNHRRYVLMDGFAPNFRIIGWLYAYEGKLDKWRRDSHTQHPYYCVPRVHLREFIRPGPSTESAEPREQKRPESTNGADSSARANDTTLET